MRYYEVTVECLGPDGLSEHHYFAEATVAVEGGRVVDLAQSGDVGILPGDEYLVRLCRQGSDDWTDDQGQWRAGAVPTTREEALRAAAGPWRSATEAALRADPDACF